MSCIQITKRCMWWVFELVSLLYIHSSSRCVCIYVVCRQNTFNKHTSSMLIQFNSAITLAALLNLLTCCMLDSLQQVWIFLKYTHILQADFAWHRKNANRYPHARNRCYNYHPQMLNLLTTCEYQITFVLCHNIM